MRRSLSNVARLFGTWDEWRIFLISYAIFIGVFWIYFRIDHLVPMVIDIFMPLVAPALILWLLKCWSARRGTWPESSMPPRQVRVTRAMCITGAPFFWIGWIIQRHGESIPKEIIGALILITGPLLLVSTVLGLIWISMVLAERRGTSQSASNDRS